MSGQAVPCPEAVLRVVRRLRGAGHEAVVVGGAVRDWHLGRPVHDWDLATDATPDQVVALFARVVTVGLEKGTVKVFSGDAEVEVTTYRLPGGSFLRAAAGSFGKSLEVDLGARDFTVNAVAWDPVDGRIIDPRGGLADLDLRLLRAVGEPRDRFQEDPLRIVRACRLAADMDLALDPPTAEAMTALAGRITLVPGERVRDEILRILGQEFPSKAFDLALRLGVLSVILPEVAACAGVSQNPRFHAHDVYRHTMQVVEAVPAERVDLRLVALLHDVGKPETAEDGHFYDHERRGAALARVVAERLRLGSERIRRLEHLVATHMFHYTPDMGDAAVRRLLRRIGRAHLDDALALRTADRAGKGIADEHDANMDREMRERFAQQVAQGAALTVRDLAVSGRDVMEILSLPQGPAVGQALADLLARVLDDPGLNTPDKLRALLAEWNDEARS